MSQMFAFSLLMVILYIGDVVSIKTKAWIPSVFVCGVLFILGYWTIFPQNIVEVAGIPTVVATLLMYLLITNMGTLLSVKELVNQWKTIVIALSGILGIIALLLAVGTFVFDLKTVLVAIPPLVGGLVSSLVMSEAAQSAGLASLSVLAILIYVIQGFAGYPLTSIVLKKKESGSFKNIEQGHGSQFMNKRGKKQEQNQMCLNYLKKYPNDIIQIIHEFYV
ncbi:hypothetical protein WME_00240 [Enterococcus faecalis EnGen0362]|nr:hypothetical protein WME_00240 [Enterococcus faecalis EnGen0362]